MGDTNVPLPSTKHKHRPPMPHLCNYCKRCFSRSFTLKRHMADFHSSSSNTRLSSRQFPCILCLQIFGSPRSLALHQKTTHPPVYSTSSIDSSNSETGNSSSSSCDTETDACMKEATTSAPELSPSQSTSSTTTPASITYSQCAFSDCRMTYRDDEMREHYQTYHTNKSGDVERYCFKESGYDLCFSNQWSLEEFRARINGKCAASGDLLHHMMPCISIPTTSSRNYYYSPQTVHVQSGALRSEYKLRVVYKRNMNNQVSLLPLVKFTMR